MHSSYYKYDFISPASICALVKEQMKTYFATGVVDDLLFPIWISQVLGEFKKAQYDLQETMLFVDGFNSVLPQDFGYVREAWSTTCNATPAFRLPGTHYHSITSRMDIEQPDRCKDQCDPCAPEEIHIYYKTDVEQSYIVERKQLLKPGNLAAKDYCYHDSPNLLSSSFDSFDVKGNKFITSFRNGEVYLLYYAKILDEEGYPMIPDDDRIKKAIEAYLRYQLYLQLWDATTDETYNQIQSKMMFWKQQYEEKRYMADLETKKDTVEKMVERTKSIRRKMKNYNL